MQAGEMICCTHPSLLCCLQEGRNVLSRKQKLMRLGAGGGLIRRILHDVKIDHDVSENKRQ